MAAIKDEKLVRVAVVERVHDASAQIFAGPGGAKPLAFDAQERDFVERINHSQGSVEFQAIDHADRVADPNMFGPQITVPIDDTPRPHALGEKRCPLNEEAALYRVDVAHRSGRQAKTRIEQNPPVVGEAAPELRQVNRW